MIHMNNTMKNAIKLALVLLPFAAVGGFFTGRYLFATLDADMQQMVLEQLGSVEVLAIVSMVQSVMYAFVCAILGYLLAEKTGLLKSFTIKPNMFVKAVVISVVCGVLFALDYWIFGALSPEVAASYESGIIIRSMDNWIASVFYGGIVEELLLRFFLMSLVALVIWKGFFKKSKKEELPVKVFVIANAVCAFVFAAGHLPATISTFGELSLVIIFRCFLLNGVFGFVFGELYRKYGIQYAMIGHMGTHIVSKLIWLILV